MALPTDIPLPANYDDSEFSRLVDFARAVPIDEHTIARLASHLAESGDRFNWPAGQRIADVASTGGPGSLSTLIPPFILHAIGFNVVKIGVPGRPAGAIDTLATIPGYRPRLSRDEVDRVIDRCGFAHFLADERFAPLDAALFAYRRRVGAVDVPLLAAASLLSKKLAAGVTGVGLDVRLGRHGNFGRTPEAARSNATMFCKAAAALGIRAIAFLSPTTGPAQPYIGRGESLVALGIAAGICSTPRDGWLMRHIEDCAKMAQAVALEFGNCSGCNVAGPFSEIIRPVLQSHLEAQGASLDALQRRITAVIAAPRRTVVALESGVLDVDLGGIRAAIVRVQGGSGGDPFNDPAGIELLVCPGKTVSKGDDLALLRCERESEQGTFESEIARALVVESKKMPNDLDPQEMELIRAY